jgi:DNA replication and repair protein RecF
LTQGAPGERRKFIDSAISQADHSYLLSLIEYTKILKQRSALLNLLRENRRKEYLNELDAWDAQLVRYGARLVNIRYSFIEEFRRYVEEAYRQIMDTREIPSIDYQMPGGMNRTISEDEFLRSLNSRREDEIRRGMNLTGPHRDDFVFLVNDKPLKVFGSQGQHKTFQIALRFAEYFYLKEKSATAPIFLLDDVFGELDTRRALKISAYLEMIAQAFITITDFSNYRFLNEQSSGKIIRIEQGAVHYG